MRGSVSGSLWGLVIGGACLGVVSQVGDLPGRAAPANIDPVSSAATPVAPEVDAEPDVALSQVDAPPVVPIETPQDAPAPELPVSEDEPATVPETIVTAPEVTTPAPETAPPAIIATPDVPVEPAVPAASPPELTAEAAPAIDVETIVPTPGTTADAENEQVVVTPPERVNEPAVTDVPIVDEPAVAEVPADDVADLAEADTIAPAPEQPVVAATPDAAEPQVPPAVEAPVAAPRPQIAPVVPEVAEVTPTEPAPRVIETPQAAEPEAEVAAIAPAPVILPEPGAETETTPGIAPDAPAAQTQDVASNTTDLPTTGNTVRVNRPGTTPTAQAGQEAELVPEAEIPEDAPALLRFATAFENPEGLPMLSLIMVDDPNASAAPGQVADLGFPVTIILDPLSADASTRMAAYRAAGVEVGIQAPLPGGATPSDVEVAFEAALAAVPDAVVLFSDGEDGVQRDRAVTEQVVRVLAADGRGLVTVQRGLGNALRIAEQADVPAASVLRDLDGDGQSPSAIGRALDQAAFRARQSGDAVLLAKVSDATLGALADWGGKIGNDQYLLAPVTAILKDQIPAE